MVFRVTRGCGQLAKPAQLPNPFLIPNPISKKIFEIQFPKNPKSNFQNIFITNQTTSTYVWINLIENESHPVFLTRGFADFRSLMKRKVYEFENQFETKLSWSPVKPERIWFPAQFSTNSNLVSYKGEHLSQMHTIGKCSCLTYILYTLAWIYSAML